jgi:hypothetical protein
MMLARTWLGLLTSFFVFTASVTARAQCSKDVDCKGDRVCETGQCVSPPPPAPAAAPQAAPAPSPAAPAVTYPAPAAPAAAPAATQQTPAEAPVPKTERNSVALMAGGLTLISIAPIVLLIAAVAAAEKGSCNRYPDTGGYYDPETGQIEYSREDCDRYDPTIYGFTIGGIALFAAGIPMFVVGSRRVPVKDPAAARIAPWVSPTGAGATLRLDL